MINRIKRRVLRSRTVRNIAFSAVVAYIIVNEKRRKNGKKAFK